LKNLIFFPATLLQKGKPVSFVTPNNSFMLDSQRKESHSLVLPLYEQSFPFFGLENEGKIKNIDKNLRFPL